MAPGKRKRAGRVALKVAERLKTEIASGRLQVGQYVPCMREVGRKHHVSPETARRALKAMEAEHWVRVHPRHGFRVTAQGNDPSQAAPVAFVLSGIQYGGRWTNLCNLLLAALHRAAEGRGWSMLGIGTEGRRIEDMVGQLRTARAAGLVLDTHNAELIEALRRLGMPTVMVEEPGGASRLDCISQDNFGGACKAAEYLAGRGHRRVGWFGMIAPTVQSRERWGGALAGLRDSGAAIAPEHSLNSAAPDAGQRLRAMLAQPERPSGLLALWWDAAAAAARIAQELGLVPGRDLEMVSWCPEEQLAEFAAACPGGKLPATMTWSMTQLADAALVRLAERRARPEMPPVRINIDTQLRPAEAT